MVTRAPDRRADAWAILGAVLDPEVPALSVVDLGIVRGVAVEGDEVEVVVTPTYSGCPAMREIERDIVRALEEGGFTHARVRTVYAPAWTTDWISEDGRRKLREYGIAPPPARDAGTEEELVPITPRRKPVACPFCGSVRTEPRGEFGSTACKATMYCSACSQPFEVFKSI